MTAGRCEGIESLCGGPLSLGAIRYAEPEGGGCQPPAAKGGVCIMDRVWEFAVYAPAGLLLYESAAAELDLPPWQTVQALAVDPDTYPGVHIAVVPDGRAVYVLREDGLWMAGLSSNGRGFLAVRYRPHAWRKTALQLASIVTALPPGMGLRTRHQTPAGVEEGDGHAAGLVTVLCLQAIGAWSYPSWWTEDAGTSLQ